MTSKKNDEHNFKDDIDTLIKYLHIDTWVADSARFPAIVAVFLLIVRNK